MNEKIKQPNREDAVPDPHKRKTLKRILDFGLGTAASAALPISEAHGARTVERDRARQPDIFPNLNIQPELRGVISTFISALALEFNKHPGLSAEDFLRTREGDFVNIANPYINQYMNTLGAVRPGEKIATPLGIHNRALGFAFAFATQDRKLDMRVTDCLFIYWNQIAERLERATVIRERTIGSLDTHDTKSA